jgi:hypothetical protein
MLTILYPPSPNAHPGLTRRCSRSSTAESTSYPPDQPSRPVLTRWCPQSSSCILRACQVRLASVSSGCASPTRTAKCILVKCASLPSVRNVLLTPGSTSPPSPLLLHEHPGPPSSPPCPECCLCPLCALLAGGGEKQVKFPLPGPLYEAHTAFPSPLGVLYIRK